MPKLIAFSEPGYSGAPKNFITTIPISPRTTRIPHPIRPPPPSGPTRPTTATATTRSANGAGRSASSFKIRFLQEEPTMENTLLTKISCPTNTLSIRNNSMKYQIAILPIILLASCSTGELIGTTGGTNVTRYSSSGETLTTFNRQSVPAYRDWSKCKIGMTKQQVRSIFGEPQHIAYNPENGWDWFEYDNNVQVLFGGDRVRKVKELGVKMAE